MKNIILDTGCSGTMVKKELVEKKKTLPGQMVSVRCAHGDAVQYPLATVSMDVKGHPIQVVEAVSETLPAAALLDTDVSELVQLLEGRSLGPRKEEEGFLATTRSQARRQKEEEEECRRKEMQSGAQPTALGTEDMVSGQGDEEEGIPEDGREHRAGHSRGWMVIYSRAPQAGEDVTESEETNSQGVPTRKLGGVRSSSYPRHPYRGAAEASGGGYHTSCCPRETAEWRASIEAGEGLLKRDDLVFRNWKPFGCDSEKVIEQMVLLTSCRYAVLKLTHEIPLVGHLGRNKTTRRIVWRFYWLTIYKMSRSFAEAAQTVSRHLQTRETAPHSYHCLSSLNRFRGLQWILLDPCLGANQGTVTSWWYVIMPLGTLKLSLSSQ